MRFDIRNTSLERNVIEETTSVRGFPDDSKILSDEYGPTSISMAIVGAAIVAYIAHKRRKRNQ